MRLIRVIQSNRKIRLILFIKNIFFEDCQALLNILFQNNQYTLLLMRSLKLFFSTYLIIDVTVVLVQKDLV